MSFSITGKTAIVTGAANGVGLAIAKQFVDHGANVMYADRDEEHLKSEVGKAEEDAGTARYFAGDLRERLTQANLLSATIDAFDRVDILVNASRQIEVSDPLEPDADQVEAMMQQNMLTSLRMTQLVAKRMIKQAETEGNDEEETGSIVNLSSIAPRQTHPKLLGYSIASAALDQLTRSMAVALAPHRIRVNSVAFGSVMSASLKDVLKDNRELRGQILDCTPMSRIAKSTEVADAVQYLASPGAGFVTGQIITIDGGRTLLDPVTLPAH
ncbi:SDR family NAD(P)-dependent oxidoreductase [Tropicimonas sp. S265A]|uniref:SDR family NAD(P)-dependent oxidoreductase n=1 Tax=Tropicimonas sp. S265A TaxID=3415134 RepID=UPI003C7B200D